MGEKTRVWVLWHRYSDGSGAHIERVYFDPKRGGEDLALIQSLQKTGGDGEWHLESLEGEMPEPKILTGQITPQNAGLS